MSEISLRDYLKRVDELIQSDNAEAAIHHCRHILKNQPKNAETYRALGRALVRASRWEEAAEVFRRLLSSFPNDYAAHRNLAESYHQLKKHEPALWHLERAFDHKPGDATILKRLREFYKEYRGVDVDRVQLTAGAAARQYMRSGLYGRAVDILRKAVEQFPNRVDLQLLLAQALWMNNRQLESAEIAIEVLKKLPYALEANQILTELWLMEQRPSDAQRYLGRLEAIDPYLAFELATNTTINNDVVMLEELDYSRVAQTELVERSPDWLENLGEQDISQAVGADPGWLGDAEEAGKPTKTATPKKKVTDDLSDLLPDDWEASIDSIQQTATMQTSALAEPDDDDFDDLFDDLDDGMTDSSDFEETMPAAPTTRKSTGLTGLLHALDEDADNDDTWLKKVQTGELDASIADRAATSPDAQKTVQKAQDSGTGLTGFLEDLGDAEPEQEKTGFTDLLGALEDEDDQPGIEFLSNDAPEEDFVPSNDAADPLAWMKQTGIEFSDEEQQDLFADFDDGEVAVKATNEDPMAWARATGVDFDETSAPRVVATDDEETDENDPMAWARSMGMDLDEVEVESPVTSSPPVSQHESVVDEVGDWLADDTALQEMMDLEGFQFDTQEPTTENTHPTVDELADAPEIGGEADWQPEAIADWEAETLDDLLTDNEEDEEGMETAEPAPTMAANPLDLFGDLDESLLVAGDDDSDWNPAAEADALLAAHGAEANPEPEEEDPLAWAASLGVEVNDTDELFSPDEDPMAWAKDSGLEFVNEQTGQVDLFAGVENKIENEVPKAERQDAMSDEQPSDWKDDTGLEWLDDDAQEPAGLSFNEPDAKPDWMSAVDDMQDKAGDQTVAVPRSMLDKIREEGFVPKATEPAESTSDEMGFDWFSGDKGESEAVTSDVPDWLNQAMPLVDTDELSENVAPEWLGEVAPSDTGELQGEPELADETPAWLSQSAPVDEEEPEDEAVGFDWMDNIETEAETPEDEEPLADETPAWLSQSAPVDEEEPEDEAVGFDWMDNIETEAETPEDEEPLADETPAWLSQSAPVDEEEPEAEAVGFDWMDNIETEAETPEDEEPLADETPAWLSQSAPVDEEEPEAEAVGFDWMDNIETEAETPEDEEPLADETPAWLSQSAPVDEEEPEAEAEAAPAWLNEASIEDEEPLADETPAWLSQSAPVDEEEPEDEAEAAPAWLNEASIEDEEPLADETPAWLSQSAPVDEEEPEDEAETLAWADEITLLEADELAEDEEALADETPAWLSQSAPVDEEEPEDEAEAAPAWLNEASIEDEEPEAEAVPSWLSEAGALDLLEDDESEAEATPAWLNETDPTTLDMLEDETPEEESFDWMSEINADEMEEAAEEAQSEFAWVSSDLDAENEEEELEEEVNETPAWISDVTALAGVDTSESALAEDVPDWLSEAVPSDELEEAEEEGEGLAAEIVSSSEGWFEEDEPDTLEDEAEAVPSWLSQTAPIDDSLLDEEEAAPAFDWETEAQFEETETPAYEWAQEAELEENETGEAEEEFQWASEHDTGELQYTSASGMTGLLNNIRATRDDEDVLTPEWLETAETEEKEPVSALETPEDEAMLDWMSDTGEMETIHEPVAEDSPMWLNAYQDEEEAEAVETTPAWISEADVEEEFEESAVPSWLNGVESDDIENEEVAPAWMSQTDLPSALTEIDEMTDDTTVGESFSWTPEPVASALELEEDEELQEETAPIPAENAPDWLNAMVPGLDIDFEAQEDAPIEQSFLEETQVSASTDDDGIEIAREFAWLTTIAKTEEKPMPEMPPLPEIPVAPHPGASPAPVAPRRRFTFSKPPAWLSRMTTGGTKSTPTETASTPSYLEGFDDDFDFDDDK